MIRGLWRRCLVFCEWQVGTQLFLSPAEFVVVDEAARVRALSGWSRLGRLVVTNSRVMHLPLRSFPKLRRLQPRERFVQEWPLSNIASTSVLATPGPWVPRGKLLRINLVNGLQLDMKVTKGDKVLRALREALDHHQSPGEPGLE